MGEEKSKNIGGFTFENYKEKNYDKSKEAAIELMCRHFEFYEELKSPDIEYVTRGAKLSCTHGNKYIYLDAVKDHGVYDGENPVLTRFAIFLILQETDNVSPGPLFYLLYLYVFLHLAVEGNAIINTVGGESGFQGR